jgi:hypothetical protein
MPRLAHGLLIFILAATCTLAWAQKGEELALFRKYYSSAQSAAERKEAVLTLEHLDDPGVLAVLYPKLGEKNVEPDVAEAIVRVIAGFQSDAQHKQVFETLKAEKAEPGKLALLQAIALGRWPDRLGVLPLQLLDKSWEVRRRALDALVACDGPAAAEKIAPLCGDPQDVLRFKALDALAGFGSRLVLPRAIALLDDPSRQVRQSAIRALALVRDKSAVEPLIRRLQKEEGLLVLDLADSLGALTGREFGLEPVRWAQWWSEQDTQTYDIPTPEGVAYLRGHRPSRSGTGGGGFPDTNPGGPVFPVPTPSRRVIYVIDCSGSMETLVTERERYEGQHYPDFSRMEIVKAELQREIERLPSYVKFNIIAFATDVDPWKPTLQPANVLVKYAAKEWVKRLYAIGGESRQALALNGLTGASNIEKGKTDAFDALRVALGVDDLRTADATYAKVEADTVFFLSDGRPTAGLYTDPDDILREVRKLNELRKVVIHTIGIGEFDKDFMKRLAEENGPGQFVDLGK